MLKGVNGKLYYYVLSRMTQTFIFVDGSYYCFYRYYALLKWWKNAYPNDPLNNPYENDKFIEKFRKTFVSNLRDMPKRLGISIDPTIIVGRDCKRENIWRNKLFPNYKANRAPDDGFMGGPFFKMAYDEALFQAGGATRIVHHPRLEADDCIALSVQHVLSAYPDCRVTIITSDRDYLQLNAPNVKLYTLGYKNLADGKQREGRFAHQNPDG